MIVDIGQIALVTTVIVAIYVVLASFLGASKSIPVLIASGRYGFYTIPSLLSIATVALIYSFITNDFSVRYVAENSNLSMPQQYTWVALYASNAGSLLFLVLVFSILAVLAVLTMRRKLPYTTPYATGIMTLMIVFLLGIIVWMANPLERLPLTPLDGQGINPLLLHFGMFIHPPMQMTGLVAVAIPFSIAMGALLSGRAGQDEWVDLGRLWGMIAWLILTLGLMLGAWWAYTILGWGGYWAWDPVENSALMPWLALTGFIHSIMVQKRRGMFRMWNMVLIIVAFTFAQMGMFINRGGPVPSVHSFAQSSMGWMFLLFMIFTLVGSMVVFFCRMDTLKSRENLDSIISRESALLIQNVLFLVVAFVTLWGTIFPIFSEATKGDSVTVGQPFFNRVNGPMLLLLIFVMGVGVLLPWRKTAFRNVVRLLKYPAGVAVATAVMLVLLGIRQTPAVVGFSICAFVVAGILYEWLRGTRSRHRKGESYYVAFFNLLTGNRPRYGGYVVHLAIIMFSVGVIASSFYSVQRDIALSPGDTGNIGDYSFQYKGVSHYTHLDREEYVAHFDVFKGGTYLGLMQPFRAVYPEFRISATRGAIRSTPIEDFYIVPSSFNDRDEAVFRVLINPLVWWMWMSGPLLILGFVIAMWPQRRSNALIINGQKVDFE